MSIYYLKCPVCHQTFHVQTSDYEITSIAGAFYDPELSSAISAANQIARYLFDTGKKAFIKLKQGHLVKSKQAVQNDDSEKNKIVCKCPFCDSNLTYEPKDS